jgi:hemoglobin
MSGEVAICKLRAGIYASQWFEFKYNDCAFRRNEACPSGDKPGSVYSMNEAEVMGICGENGIRRMVAAFYQRVRTDELIGPMYPEADWQGSEERLAEFLLFRLGASTRYLETRGHPKLRMRHITFKIGIAERDRWLELMASAMVETSVPAEARGFLDPFFAQVADFMRNQADR